MVTKLLKLTIHEETAGLGDVAIDKLTGDIIDNQTIKLDSVSGATITSVAFLEAQTCY